MTVQTQNQNSPDIWKWKNTAHIAKVTLRVGFAIALFTAAATAIYAAAKGVALSSLLPAFLANPWVIAAIATIAFAYFAFTAISSYQQMHSMEGAKGQDGKNGRDANFSDLLGDAIIKSGTISVEKDGETDQLFLKLSKENYQALVSKETVKDALASLHMLSIKDGKAEAVKVEFKRVDAPNDNGNYKVKLENPNKKALGVADNATSLEVAVSNKNCEALKNDVSAKLADVAVNAAITKVTGK